MLFVNIIIYQALSPISVKAPRSSQLDYLDAHLVVAVQQQVRHAPAGVFVREFEGFGPEPLHTNDRNERVRQDAAHGGVRLEFFELAHATLLSQFLLRLRNERRKTKMTAMEASFSWSDGVNPAEKPGGMIIQLPAE